MKFACVNEICQIPGSAPTKGPMIEHKKDIGLWAIRLPSADSTVVRRTLYTLSENPQGLPGSNETIKDIEKRTKFWSSVKPAHFGVKMGSKSFFDILRFIALGNLVAKLSNNSFGRWLLLTFPFIFSLGCFSKKGPSENEVKNCSFKMWFFGRGFENVNEKVPNMEIVTRVMGPEPGYVATPIILLQCALVVLSQREGLPKGGTLTPGVVFGATDLQTKLQENGITFDVISEISDA